MVVSNSGKVLEKIKSLKFLESLGNLLYSYVHLHMMDGFKHLYQYLFF